MTRPTPRQTEPSANTALGELLKGMLSGCQVRAEHTGLIAGRSGLQLDLLMTAPDRAPVAVEAEYLPARTVEPEATARLGLRVVDEPNPIEAAIALRYPRAVGDADDLRAAITAAELSYCVFTQERRGTTHPAASAAFYCSEAVASVANIVGTAVGETAARAAPATSGPPCGVPPRAGAL